MGFAGVRRLTLRVDAPARAVVQIGEIVLPVPEGTPSAPPARPGPLLGRAGELARIARAVEGAARAVVVTGGPGSGRSATAVEAAHRLAPRFPDGVLAETLGDRPVSAADLARRVLIALGEPDPAPDPVTDPVAVCRAALARRRVLLLLDDAADAAAADLLPPGSRSAVLLTARRGLGLPRVRLGRLDPAAAAALLGSDDPRILAACDGMPLALRIAALRLATEPVSAVAEALTPAHRTLSALRVGDRGMREAVQRAAAALRPGPRAVLRGLGAFPLADVTAETAAALTGISRAEAESALAALADADLLRGRAWGRYELPVLVRRFAEEDARDRGGPRETAAAGDRIARVYATALERADPGWWAAEWPNLVPLARHLDGRDRHRLDHLADVAADRRRSRAPWAAWSEIQRAALRHAEAEGPPHRRAALQVRLAHALRERGDPGAALAMLAGAEERFADAGDPAAAADAARAIADVHRDRGERALAATGYRRVLGALAAHTGADALRTTAWALSGLGELAAAEGDTARATRLRRAALDRFRALDDAAGLAAVGYQASSSRVVGSAAPSWPSRASTSSGSGSNGSGSGWSELTGAPSGVASHHRPPNPVR